MKQKSYAQVIKQIESLQAEAEKLRRAEIDGVIQRIRGAIEFYKLTAEDLGLSAARVNGAGASGPLKRKSRKSAAPKAPLAVKYRNDSGGTWGGIGKRPQWLRDALAGGKTLDDFLVK